MTKHLRQYGLAALFAMVLLAAVPASGGDNNEAPTGGETLGLDLWGVRAVFRSLFWGL